MPLLHDNTCVVDFYFSRGQDHLMIFMLDMDAEAPEFAYKALDLLLEWVAAHVTEIFVTGAAEYLEDRSRQPISDGYLGFVGGTKA